MLPGVCPGCGLRADLDVFCAQADVNKTLAAALAFPAALGGRVLAYLRLFSPPSKSLALSKATRLLTELSAAVTSAQVRRQGLTRVAPLELWGQGLDAVVARPPESLPLTTHHYLFQTVWNLAEKAAARSERAAEANVRSPAAALPPSGAREDSPVTADAAPPAPVFVPPPPEFKELLRKLTGRMAFPTPTTPTVEE